MLNKKEIRKLIKSITRRQRGLRDHQIIHPRRDWMIGFLAGLLFLIVGGTWSFITYKEIGERDVESVDVGVVKQTVYREDIVEAALEQFRERKESYQVLLKQADEVVLEEIDSNVEESEIEVTEEIEGDEENTEPETATEEITEELLEDEIETLEEEQPAGPPTEAPDVNTGV